MVALPNGLARRPFFGSSTTRGSCSPCHGHDASDSATRTVDSLGGPAKDEQVKTVKCCVKQKAQQGGVEN
jgi:hypothetical protein